jgi:hypothetical protein
MLNSTDLLGYIRSCKKDEIFTSQGCEIYSRLLCGKFRMLKKRL